jgi:hypothetical protein
MVTFVQNLLNSRLKNPWDFLVQFIHFLNLWKSMLSIQWFVIFFQTLWILCLWVRMGIFLLCQELVDDWDIMEVLRICIFAIQWMLEVQWRDLFLHTLLSTVLFLSGLWRTRFSQRFAIFSHKFNILNLTSL